MHRVNNDKKETRGCQTVPLKLEFVYVVIIALLLGACTTTPIEDSVPDPQPRTTDKRETGPAGVTADRQTASESETDPTVTIANDAADEPVKHADTWKRIRHNLVLQRDLSRSRVQAQLAFYGSRQEYLDRVAERATPYLYYIVEELKKRNMPLDLALLPIVESAYQPFAYSRSHASGIWQFIPGTGRHYGLKQNWWYDGRRDIIASTDAALTYLQRLHDYFDGDWLLAIAAYNAGERTVERAVQRNIKAGKPADFWSLSLRRETMHYIPSLLAVAEIVAQPEKYQVTLKSIPNEPYFDVVDTGSQIDLALVAELTGLDSDELRALNPGIKKSATDPEGPHHLLLPLDITSDFQRKLAAIPASQRVRWQVYHVRQGDTLGKIARMYNTDVSALKQANKLNSNLIRAGHSLLIPGAYHATGNADKVPDRGETGKFHTAAHNDVTAAPVTYTIRQGDTLWNIGRQFDVSVNDLCRWNGIQRNSILTPGKTLLVHAQQSGGFIQAVADNTQLENRHVSYTVQSGDSLWQIARRFGVTVEQIQRWNSMNQQTALKPGQNLDIYIGQPPADV